ncbi:MAG: histidine kinase [Spirosomataceae bacterium]
MHYTDFYPYFIGMMAMMMIYMALQYLFLRDKVYLYYKFYILCWILFFSLRGTEFYNWVGADTPLAWGVFVFHRIAFPMLSYVLYFWFAKSFLDLPNTFPGVWKVFKTSQWILLGYVAYITYVSVFDVELHKTIWFELLHSVMRIFTAVLSIYGIQRVYRSGTVVGKYFVTGSLLLLVFGLVAMVLSILDEFEDDNFFWKIPLFYMQVGIILEILCFSLGLSYRNKQIEYQKNSVEQALKSEREQREIEQLRIALEKQELSRQMTNLRMRALRSQMNPHFLFNSLNAIQECIITNQTDAAMTYLAKFSRLVRLILENSDRQTIPLSKEVETLRLYLDVESLRFTHSFHYELQVQTHLDPTLINIPPMLVQPYVENAIWHGLLHKKGERQLGIVFDSDDDSLYVTIEDNGIGRKKSATFESPAKKSKTSMGMKLTSERLNIINEQYDNQAKVTVQDLLDTNGNSLGTKITLTLPLL